MPPTENPVPVQPDPTADPSPPGNSFVTGATGLLGSQLVRLLLAGGGRVTALVRDSDRAERLLPADPALRLVAGDVCDLASYRPHLAGTDVVFHTAAYFREYFAPGPDPDRLHQTNVTAVAELLHASADAGVPVLVHTSSTTVLGTGRPGLPPGTPLDEDSPPSSGRQNAYQASKLAAERVVAEVTARTGQRVPVVLPAWMWGPGDAGPTSAGRLFLAVARGEL
jgi:nucleoside-diphosphate-sugar epimerase